MAVKAAERGAREPFKPPTLSFEDGARGSCPHFSIAIPDGFALTASPADGLAFVATPQDEASPIRMISGVATPVSLEDLLQFDKSGFIELYYAYARLLVLDVQEPGWRFLGERVLEAQGCSVLVTRFSAVDSEDQVYWLQPINHYPDHGIRVDVRWGRDGAESLMPLVGQLVSGVSVGEWKTSDLVYDLNRARSEVVDPARFGEICQSLFRLLNSCRQMHYAADQAQHLSIAGDLFTADLMNVVVSGIEECGERILPYVEACVEAYEAQLELGVDDETIRTEGHDVLSLLGCLLVKFEPDGREEAEYMREHGPIEVPDRFWELSDRIAAVLGSLA